ncbi:hypothetical protein [Novosphingobium sp. SG720]|uniref:hypothetical protein n=1 Tax=Novosphingobium sp. SG720 TaxID=2586998 RepID=UPI001446A3BA|nr:hypothetical protein [Novosphingobium sp. SG720]NKJ43684.1 hypothetical protein [Novosphingobium sp. SG720]
MTAPRETLPQLAALLYRRRAEKATAVVASGKMTRDQAKALLRPWLAIACTVGADLPGLEDAVAQRRTGHEHFLNPGHARWLAADDICPRSIWAGVLAGARDQAFDKFVQDSSLANAAAARDLQRLCLALERDVNGHHIPAYRPAIDATAKAA